MSLSSNFPIIKPSLNLDFVNVGTLDPRITFTRASTATFFNSAGVLTSAANDVPRFDYNPSTLAPQGLLIEEQRTNVFPASNDFANATYWNVFGTAVATAGAGTGPDGLNSAVNLAGATDLTLSGNNIDANISVSASTEYQFSVFVKSNGGTAVWLRLRDGTGGSTSAAFTVTSSWTRISLNRTMSVGATSVRCIIGDTNGDILIYGAQLEAGAFPTSYIPTTTTALTRSADVASMTGTNFSSWYNAVEGTLFAQSQTAQAYAAGVPARVSIDDGTITNRIAIRNGNNFSSVVSISGSSVAGLESGAWNSNIAKQAIAYKVDDFAYTTNGASVVTDALGAIPSVNRLGIGLTGTQNYLNGYIQRIAYYPTRLANAQLQALTG